MSKNDSGLLRILSLLGQNPELLQGVSSLLSTAGVEKAGGAGGAEVAGGQTVPVGANALGSLLPLLQQLSAKQNGNSQEGGAQVTGNAIDHLQTVINDVLAETPEKESVHAGKIMLGQSTENNEIKEETTDGALAADVAGISASQTDLGGAGVLAGALSTLAASSGGRHTPHLPNDQRLALLIALKPYLSPSRAAAVDQMVRLGKLGTLLEGLLPVNGGK